MVGDLDTPAVDAKWLADVFEFQTVGRIKSWPEARLADVGGHQGRHSACTLFRRCLGKQCQCEEVFGPVKEVSDSLRAVQGASVNG